MNAHDLVQSAAILAGIVAVTTVVTLAVLAILTLVGVLPCNG